MRFFTSNSAVSAHPDHELLCHLLAPHPLHRLSLNHLPLHRNQISVLDHLGHLWYAQTVFGRWNYIRFPFCCTSKFSGTDKRLQKLVTLNPVDNDFKYDYFCFRKLLITIETSWLNRSTPTLRHPPSWSNTSPKGQHLSTGMMADTTTKHKIRAMPLKVFFSSIVCRQTQGVLYNESRVNTHGRSEPKKHMSFWKEWKLDSELRIWDYQNTTAKKVGGPWYFCTSFHLTIINSAYIGAANYAVHLRRWTSATDFRIFIWHLNYKRALFFLLINLYCPSRNAYIKNIRSSIEPVFANPSRAG